jgi:plastocyanin
MTQKTLRLFLPLLILGLAACNEEVAPAAAPPAPQPATQPTLSVSIVQGASVRTEAAFDPNPAEIEPGTTVTWTNNDTVDHTVTADDESRDSGRLRPGQTFSRTFGEEGEFDYFCEIHPQMMGTVVVRPTPSPSPSPGASPAPSPSPGEEPSPGPSPGPDISPSPGGQPGPGPSPET